MKIGYFADGPWSHKALEALLRNEHEICFIVPRYDTQDLILREWSDKLNVPFLPVENVNSAQFIKLLSEFHAELFISMSFNQILKKEIIAFAPKGFINCHAGMLPFYRGRNPLNWALINGERSLGVTAHFIDEGIDTGDIIFQDIIPISNEDTYSTLLDKAIQACPTCLCKAVELLERDNFIPIRQDTIHPTGTYFGQRRVGDEVLDWHLSSERIYNFVRAITKPGPGARTFVNGKKEIAIITSRMIENAPEYISTMGEVVGKNSSGIIVKTGTSTILVTKVEDIELGIEHIPAYRIGTRLTPHRTNAEI